MAAVGVDRQAIITTRPNEILLLIFIFIFYVTIDKNASLDVCALNATLIMFFDKL